MRGRYQSQVRFVNERRGLQRLAAHLAGQFGCCQLAQLVVNQRQQSLSGQRVALSMADRIRVTSLIGGTEKAQTSLGFMLTRLLEAVQETFTAVGVEPNEPTGFSPATETSGDYTICPQVRRLFGKSLVIQQSVRF